MRRFLTLFITPVIGLLIVFLHLPLVEAWLAKKNPDADIWIIIGFIILVIVNHVLTIVSPLKKYERLNKQKWYILNVLIEQINKDYRKYDMCFNLMIPKRKWFCNIEIKKNKNGKEIRSWKVFCKVFDFVWWSKNHPVNKKLKLTVNQGIAGKVYREGKGFLHNFVTSKEGFGLNSEQIKLTQSLKLLFSFPVLKDDGNFEDKETNKVLAVLNAESESNKSLALFGDEKEIDKLSDDLDRIAKICKKII